MTTSQIQIAAYQQDGLHIVDSKGRDAESPEQRVESFTDYLLMESFYTSMEYWDGTSEEWDREIAGFRQKMGLPLTPRQVYAIETMS